MPEQTHTRLLAFDPGREKCGLAVLDAGGSVVEKTTVQVSDLRGTVEDLVNKHQLAGPVRLAVGGGTGSDLAYEIATEISPGRVVWVSEKDTTLEARELAWRENPPGGLWRILPRLFWPTPPDLDAWAAVVIGRRALEQSGSGGVGRPA